MTTAVLFVAFAALAGVALHRDIKRAVRRRRMRELTAPLRAAFRGFQVAVGTALLPSLAQAVRAAADMERAMRQVQVTLTADTSQFKEALRRAAKVARGDDK